MQIHRQLPGNTGWDIQHYYVVFATFVQTSKANIFFILISFRDCHRDRLLWMVPDPGLQFHFRFLRSVLGSICGCRHLSPRYVQKRERNRNKETGKGHKSSWGSETRWGRGTEGASQRQPILGHHRGSGQHGSQEGALIHCWLLLSLTLLLIFIFIKKLAN